jgi:hypothetical protein
MNAIKLGLAAGVCLLAACQSVNLEEPARLNGVPSSACLTQLTRFASESSKRPVTLNEQAFAQSDRLLLERPLIRGADGRPLDGRSMERPEVFRLVRSASVCGVIHENTGRRAELAACDCRGA